MLHRGIHYQGCNANEFPHRLKQDTIAHKIRLMGIFMLTLPPSSLNYSPKCPSQEAVNWGSVSQNLYLEDCLPKNDIAVAVKHYALSTHMLPLVLS